MYLARHLTTMSLPQISGRLGGRDHTTAISGVGKIKRVLATDIRLAADIDNLKFILGVPK